MRDEVQHIPKLRSDYLNAKPDSEEFRKEFRRIREQFIEKLDQQIAGRVVLAFRTCDTNGQPLPWIWDDEACKFAHYVGTIEHAKAFMRNMIDQGMLLGFAGASTDSGLDVWLTAWEGPPSRGPVWPSGIVPLFQEVHAGVVIGEQAK